MIVRNRYISMDIIAAMGIFLSIEKGALSTLVKLHIFFVWLSWKIKSILFKLSTLWFEIIFGFSLQKKYVLNDKMTPILSKWTILGSSWQMDMEINLIKKIKYL